MTIATPVEIDTQLAEIAGRYQQAQSTINGLTESLHLLAESPYRYTRRGRVYTEPIDEATAKVREMADENGTSLARRAAATIAKLDAAYAAAAEAEAEAEPLEAEYADRRWSRFFIVTSSNGHIHSSRDCSTCGLRTIYAWLPGASGQTMAEAIAERDKTKSAALLCTVCFPDAPVEWTEAPINDALCAGSGTQQYNTATARRGYVSGNYAVCNHCETRVTLTSAWNMRKHNKAA